MCRHLFRHLVSQFTHQFRPRTPLEPTKTGALDYQYSVFGEPTKKTASAPICDTGFRLWRCLPRDTQKEMFKAGGARLGEVGSATASFVAKVLAGLNR
jgi:hypothetical protein